MGVSTASRASWCPGSRRAPSGGKTASVSGSSPGRRALVRRAAFHGRRRGLTFQLLHRFPRSTREAYGSPRPGRVVDEGTVDFVLSRRFYPGRDDVFAQPIVPGTSGASRRPGDVRQPEPRRHRPSPRYGSQKPGLRARPEPTLLATGRPKVEALRFPATPTTSGQPRGGLRRGGLGGNSCRPSSGCTSRATPRPTATGSRSPAVSLPLSQCHPGSVCGRAGAQGAEPGPSIASSSSTWRCSATAGPRTHWPERRFASWRKPGRFVAPIGGRPSTPPRSARLLDEGGG